MDRKVLVLGVGNLIMGDEGVGIHAIRLLQRQPCSSRAALVDGGTGGFHLLSLFDDYDPVVMIDAAMDGHPPGTVSLIRPRFASDFPRCLSAHDIGLRDLIETAALLGPLPEIHLITVSIESGQLMGVDLSQAVANALSEVAARVHQILEAEPLQKTAGGCCPAVGNAALEDRS